MRVDEEGNTLPDDWNDPEFARAWDAEHTRGNPARPEQLDLLLALLESEHRQGQAVLDLGTGSGRVAERILERLPSARVVGVDASPAMLDLARERLVPYGDRVELVQHDLNDTAALLLPDRDYAFALNVQALHHLSPEANRDVLRFLSHRLPNGGLFLALERIAVGTPHLFPLYRSLWEWQERTHDARIPGKESYEDHQERMNRSGDRPLTLEQHMLWLREFGFEAACLHLVGIRALIAARRVLG